MTDFHCIETKSCFYRLNSSKNGLSQKDAQKLQKKFGKNELPKEKPLGKIAIFLFQFNNPLAIILIIAGLLSLILKEYIDSIVIFGAVLINSIIGYTQENKANQAIQKLKQLVEYKTTVFRSGQEYSVDSSQIVKGDVIVIHAGNRIPADARLFECNELQINESMLTGESLSSKKHVKAVNRGAALADRENMVYAGTMAVKGSGRALVTAIGGQTEIGKIASLVSSTKEEKTPLQIRLNKFSQMLGMIFGIVCVLIVVIGLIQGRGFIEMMETGVAVGVASIPEGLTVAVTFILALGMQQILKRKALTRKLLAAETLGSTTVICTDKTGTLTEGKMHVAHIVIGEKEFEFDSLGSRQNKKEAMSVSLALQTGMMCNDAVIENPDDELAAWRIIGTATESALFSAAVQSGLNKDMLLKSEPFIAELPFDSERKYMISLHQKAKNKFVIYEKGAPEKLIEKSVKFHHQGGLKRIDEDQKKKLISTYENLTRRGLRVIGFATKEFEQKYKNGTPEEGEVSWEEIDFDLNFIGFIAIKDPLRLEAKETITTARLAGIRTVIITGDHKLTAKAIAREVGLDVKAENIITGVELEKVSDKEMLKLVKKIEIYARVSPHHKLRIVKALQARGEVVAMTGDGINDSPALKAADIGVSLGTGTDIAKETSDLILLDDNFKTIVAAIRQGRIIFKNIRKVITFLLSDVFSEMILIIGSIILGMPLALLPVQILWINIVNDSMPHFSLAYEKGSDSVMREKPLLKNEPLLNREMKVIIFYAGIARDVFVFAIFYILFIRGVEIEYLRTLMFVILGTKSLLSIFSLRKLKTSIWNYNPFSNKRLLLAVSSSFFLLILGVYFQPLQTLLSTSENFDLKGWAVAFLIGFLSIVIFEITKLKFILNKRKNT